MLLIALFLEYQTLSESENRENETLIGLRFRLEAVNLLKSRKYANGHQGFSSIMIELCCFLHFNQRGHGVTH